MEMKTIQMTIDEPLLAQLDHAAEEMATTRSAFIRQALQAALRRYQIKCLEEQDRLGYARFPQTAEESEIWATEQAWSDE